MLWQIPQRNCFFTYIESPFQKRFKSIFLTTKIYGQWFFSFTSLFSLHTLAWACGMLFNMLFSHMPYYISVNLVLPFTLCILYRSNNFQAKTYMQTYFRRHFTLQSKSFHNSIPRQLLCLKL